MLSVRWSADRTGTDLAQSTESYYLSHVKNIYWKALYISIWRIWCVEFKQYYRARKRPNEIILEYLHHVNGAEVRAKVAIRDGSHATRSEHLEHFIATLDDRDLAKQITLLRLSDADEMEETFRMYQLIINRYTKLQRDRESFISD